MESRSEDSRQSASDASAKSRALLERLRPSNLRRWERILAIGAAVLLVSGLLLKGYGALREDAPPGDAESSRLVHENGTRNHGRRSLQPGASLVGDRSSTGNPGAATRRSDEAPVGDDLVVEWSPAMIRGGFGFFAGFAIGLVLRIFLRLSIIIIGFNLLVLLGFSYLGWLDVRWDTMEVQFSQWMASLEAEFTEFKTFISGSLPTVGLSSVGLVTGFRRR